MESFVNEYEYTPEVIEEALGTWAKESGSSQRTTRSAVFLMILAVVLMIFTKSLYYIVVVIVAALCLLYLNKNQGRKLIKAEQRHIKENFGDEPPVFTITLGDDIHTKTKLGEQHIPYSRLENVVQTEHLIVLLFKQNMTIALHKDGFVQGNADDCMELLLTRKSKR